MNISCYTWPPGLYVSSWLLIWSILASVSYLLIYHSFIFGFLELFSNIINKTDVNVLTKSGLSPLHVLIITTIDDESKPEEEKKILCDEIFNIFVKKKVKLNHQDDKGFTALHYAILKNNQYTTMLLTHSKGINLNVNVLLCLLIFLKRNQILYKINLNLIAWRQEINDTTTDRLQKWKRQSG